MKRSYRKTFHHHDDDHEGDFPSAKELDVICTAAKHLNASIIREKLIHHRDLDKYRKSGKDKLIPTSILASRLMHQVRSSLELSSVELHPVRRGDKQQKTVVYTGDDEEDAMAGNAALLLRALLLLPPCSSTPWDALKIFVQVLLERKKQGGVSVRALQERTMMEQKSVIDIKMFLSFILQQDNGNEDVKQCRNSLMNAIQDIGNDIAIGIYTLETISKSSATTLFQVLISLYHVSKKITNENTNSSISDATIPFCEIIMNYILNHDGCVVNVDSNIQPQFMVLSLAYSVASQELRGDLKSHHWHSLQELIMRKLLASQVSHDTKTWVQSMIELSRSIALQILLDSPKVHMHSSKLWVGWVKILLYMYQFLSTFDKEHFTVLESEISTLLSNLQPWGILQFLKVVRGTDSDDTSHLNSANYVPKVKSWVRLNVVLLTFEARIYVGEGFISNLGQVKTDDIDTKEACVMALVDIVKQNIFLSSQMVKRYEGERNISKTNQIDLFGICCDLNRFDRLFVKCKVAIKESVHLGDEEKFAWDRMELWNKLAFYLIDSTPSVSIGRDFEAGIMFSSAILAATYFELSSARPQDLNQALTDRLYVKSTTECNRLRKAWCCWTLLKIFSDMSSERMILENNGDPSLRALVNLLSVIDKNMEGCSLPTEIVSHVFCPIFCDTKGRAQIVQFCKQELESLSNSLLPDTKPNVMIDCLLLLVGNDISHGDTLGIETLEAMKMISDEIFGRESFSLFQARRLNTLRKIVIACRSGLLRRVALERIRMASLSRLIPFLNKVDRSQTEVLLSPAPCGAADSELNLLIQLFLASCCALLSDEVEIYNIVTRNDFESENQKFSALTVALRKGELHGNSSDELSLVVKTLNALTRFQMSDHSAMHDESSVEDNWKELLNVEMKFWQRWQNMHICPSWLQNSKLAMIDTRGHTYDEEKVLQSLRCDLTFPLTHFLLTLYLNSNSFACKSQHFLSMSTTLLLSRLQHKSSQGTSQTMVDPDYICLVIELYSKFTSDFFSETIESFESRHNSANDKYLEDLFAATSSIFKIFTSLQQSISCVQSTPFHLYGSLVDAFVTLQNLEERCKGLCDLTWHQLIESILKMLDVLSEKMSTVTLNSAAFHIYFRVHLKFVTALSSKIRDEVFKDPRSLCEEKTKVINNLLAYILTSMRASLLTESFSSDDILDMMKLVHTIFQNCRNAMESCTTRKRTAFQMLFKITIVQLPDILRMINRVAFNSGTCTNQASATHLVPHDTFCIQINNDDDANKESIHDGKTFKILFERIQTNDIKLHHWGLSMRLLSFESVWTESNSLIQGRRTRHFPRYINLIEVNLFAKKQVLEFSHSLSSILDLLKLSHSDVSVEATEHIISLISEILFALQNSVECLTSYFMEWNLSGGVDGTSELYEISVFEAALCITSWIKTDCTIETTSNSATMVTSIKNWCKANNIQKEANRKKTSMILERLRNLEVALYNFREEVVKRCHIKEDRIVTKLVSSLLQPEGIQGITTDLVSFLCSYVGDMESSLEASGTAKNTSKITPKRTSSRTGTQNKMSRNKVVNEWLELDRNLDDNSSLGGYEDLEDFILPG